ncbi:MAG TPA: ImmA/IrrE family metallo-endopeptidase [Pseudonocardiaceae bacterium]|nr:ImmA/IrrE family metallo-endopeptidase [Pseudonocardiaceae bacterium]
MLENLDSAEEISTRVDRLLRAADAYGRFPTPVDDIVKAAELGHADDYVLDESRISEAPAYLRTLLRSARTKVQGLVDRRARVIHISPDLDNEGKRRFVTLHETTHHILPHQQDLLYADDNETLAPSTNRLFEREANQGAAELLFQRTRFTQDAADSVTSIATIRALAEQYGSSFHAAVRRYAETHPGAVAAIVLDRPPMPETHRPGRDTST